MSNYFAINKSGKSIPIYADADLKSSKIGNLLANEACGFDWNWGGDGYFCHVRFLSSSGTLKWGFIINPPAKGLSDCAAYPYGTATINGTKYKTFKFRRAETIYKTDGSTWGNVASGMRVACLTGLSGDSHPEWKGINYVETSSGWKQVISNSNNKYGFVSTGLSKGSGPSTLSMYGKW